jgi:hypothetical protein
MAGQMEQIGAIGGYMSRYQMFQEWWSRATSGPSDFRIDKRSAAIGFEAALDIMEKNLTAHNSVRDSDTRHP